MPFPFTQARSYAANTAFSDTITTNDAANGFSVRVVTPAVSFSGTQCRVTFKAGPSGSLITNNCSVGKSAGSGATTTTPAELKFSGASGFNISSSATITSDWVQLPDVITTSDSLVVVLDAGATAHFGYNASSTAGNYLKAATASYATASPAGFTFTASNNHGVQTVEVRL